MGAEGLVGVRACACRRVLCLSGSTGDGADQVVIGQLIAVNEQPPVRRPCVHLRPTTLKWLGSRTKWASSTSFCTVFGSCTLGTEY